MEKSELISVIIPVYNIEKYLRECVDSVLNQTYQNFEIILVDDGSTDDSGKICDYYAESNSKVQVIHKTNGGASSARNVGMKAATGKYIYFLDSDDKIVSNALYILFERAEKEAADVLFFEAYSFRENETEMIKGNYSYRNQYNHDKGHVVLESLIKNNEFHVSIPLLFIRREFLNETRLKLVEGIMYEDMIFTYELFCKANKVVHVPESLYQRRYRAGSVMQTHKSTRNFVSAYVVFQHLNKNMSQSYILSDKASKQYISKWALNTLNLYSHLTRRERNECKEDHKCLKKEILANKAYDNKALYMRCYGIFPWFCYKVFEKVFIHI
ncbi:MAG: glycosyltransferase [Lachnospiraceae bacterium]|nr:glycosyltransferase [Lachnospiraceae bacterium]